MKEYIEKYKEFKQNRRQVGLIKLGFWIVFFGVILLIYLIPTGGHKTVYTPNADAPKDEQNIVSSYAFEYTINGKKYTGLYNGNIELIGEDGSFFIQRDKILMDKEDAVLPDHTYTNIHKLDNLIASSELEATTSYKDGREEYKYINKENDNETIITYTKNSDETIDAHLEYSDNIVDIHYYDINKIELKLDEEKYIYELKEVEDEHKD